MRPSLRRLVGWLSSSPLDTSVKIPPRATFPPDDELERRRCMARETLKAAGKHIDRETDFTFGKVIEDNPDTFVRPVDFDELPV